MSVKARVIAFYLPQFHPIPENDEWWGKGFTEWTLVKLAKPLFRGHQQPNQPGELGFYDLRDPEVRQRQADLARTHGVEGFCYWHYWLGNGKQLLERPFNEVLTSGEPDLPFCLGWANHSWRGRFFGAGNRLLVQQEYPGEEDYRAHFRYLSQAFSDDRYIKVEGKPLLYILLPEDIPDLPRWADLWRTMASQAGLKGLHLVGKGLTRDQMERLGLDGFTCQDSLLYSMKMKAGANRITRTVRKLSRRPCIGHYKNMIESWTPEDAADLAGYPDIFPNWDNTPRLGLAGEVFQGSTPELFRKHVADAIARVSHKPLERRVIFLKSWNEWAEGNYIEPDQRFGRAYLEALKAEVR